LFTWFAITTYVRYNLKTIYLSKIIIPDDKYKLVSRLAIVNQKGKDISCFYDMNDGGFLGIHNNQGKVVGGMYASADGGKLDILNNQGELVGAMVARENGGGMLGIFNNQGQCIWSAP